MVTRIYGWLLAKESFEEWHYVRVVWGQAWITSYEFGEETDVTKMNFNGMSLDRHNGMGKGNVASRSDGIEWRERYIMLVM